MVFAGGEVDVKMATAADFGGGMGLPVVDLVCLVPQVNPAIVVVADDAVVDILGIGDRTVAQTIDSAHICPVRDVDGAMNFMEEDRRVSIRILHELTAVLFCWISLQSVEAQWAVTYDAGSGIEKVVCMGRSIKIRAVTLFAGLPGYKLTLGR